MKFELIESVAGHHPGDVLRVLSAHLRPMASEVSIADGRLTAHGIGASPRLRNPRDVTVIEARAEDGGTLLTVAATYQASALLGDSPQDDIVRSKIEGAIDEMRVELRVPRPVRSLPAIGLQPPDWIEPAALQSFAPHPQHDPDRTGTDQTAFKEAEIIAEPTPIDPQAGLAEPIVAKPIVAKPIVAKPTDAKPIVATPIVAEPATAKRVVVKIATAPPLAAEPITIEADPAPPPSSHETVRTNVAEPKPTFAERVAETRVVSSSSNTSAETNESGSGAPPSGTPIAAVPKSEFARYAERMAPQAKSASDEISARQAPANDLPLRGLLRGQGFVEAAEVEESSRSWTWIWWVLAFSVAAGAGGYVMRDSLPIPETWRTMLSRGVISISTPAALPASKDEPSIFVAQPELAVKPVANVYLWMQDLTAALRSSDPEAQASYYADTVDRYQGSAAVSNAAVLKDRKLAIERRERIWALRVEHTYVESQTASTARVRFVKHVMTTSAAGETAEHIAKTRLKLKKIGGSWKIVEEEESLVAAT